MSKNSPQGRKQNAQARIDDIKLRIAGLDLVCSGTLIKRMKVCGKPACRCATAPDARHGPYYEWGRMVRGKLVNRMVTRERAALLRAAIAHYRTVRRLLRTWEQQSVRIIEVETGAK